jgi:murein peptide amidase A
MQSPNHGLLQCDTWSFGQSVKGLPLWVHQLSPPAYRGPAYEGSARWDTLFIGSFHGDEGLSTQLLQQLLNALKILDKPLANSVPFAIIPVLNPDGLAVETRTNANGVDLNRNWPCVNWTTQTNDPELGINTPYYEGPAPASEPETKALLALIEAYRPRKIISIHTPYKVINYDGPAEALAHAMSAHSGYPVVGSIGYPTPGSFGTYYGVERSVPVITLELPEALSPEVLWAQNGESLLAALAVSVC